MTGLTPLAVESIPDLEPSNAHLGDPDALDEVWHRNGYWYFRGVLDLEALERFRAPVLHALKREGLVEGNADEPRYSGEGIERFPDATHAGYRPLDGLAGSRRWIDFLAEPAIDAFFTSVLGARPHWVPVAELRVTPPNEPADLGLLTYPHQDGFYNEGYRCLTSWMPLFAVPRAAGGLAVAEGMHRQGYLHDAANPPRFPIPGGAIPDTAWRTADYQPGDVVIFDRSLPHSGLRNHSRDRFRISFDVRCVLPGDPEPVVGVIEAVTSEKVRVRTADGGMGEYRFDNQSYCRGLGVRNGTRISPDEVPQLYRPGQEVMLTLEGARVRLLREPKY